MSLPVRIVLLVGCGLVAALEAPQAGAWLSAGLSGPYAPTSARAETEALASGSMVSPQAASFAPLLFTLASPVPTVQTPLAVGR